MISFAAVAAALVITSNVADARHHRRVRVHYVTIRETRSSRPFRRIFSAHRVDRGRRQHRPSAGSVQSGCAAPSGVADQDHDALPAVRAARCRQDHARHAPEGIAARRRPGSDQARSQARLDHPGRGRHQGRRDTVGERRCGHHRGKPRRQRRRLRQADDAKSPRAWHEPAPLMSMRRVCRTTIRSPRRAIRRCSAARSRTVSRVL